MTNLLERTDIAGRALPRPAVTRAHNVARPARPAYLRLADLAEWMAAQRRCQETYRRESGWRR